MKEYNLEVKQEVINEKASKPEYILQMKNSYQAVMGGLISMDSNYMTFHSKEEVELVIKLLQKALEQKTL